MRKRLLLLCSLPILLLLLTALMPLSASAASPTSATSHKSHKYVHFFVHPSHKNNHAAASASGNLVYNGGPVMSGTANVYAIFWEPSNNVSSSYNSLIQRYFNDVNGTGLYNNNTQYTDSSGQYASQTTLAGSWVDNSAYPESPLLDGDIQNEVTNAQNANGWSANSNNIFFVFLEANQDLCFDSSQSQCASNTFCAYHSSFGSSLYAAMPYAASFSCDPGGSYPNDRDADLTLNVTSHEQMEAATDPQGNAWSTPVALRSATNAPGHSHQGSTTAAMYSGMAILTSYKTSGIIRPAAVSSADHKQQPSVQKQSLLKEGACRFNSQAHFSLSDHVTLLLYIYIYYPLSPSSTPLRALPSVAFLSKRCEIPASYLATLSRLLNAVYNICPLKKLASHSDLIFCTYYS